MIQDEEETDNKVEFLYKSFFSFKFHSYLYFFTDLLEAYSELINIS